MVWDAHPVNTEDRLQREASVLQFFTIISGQGYIDARPVRRNQHVAVPTLLRPSIRPLTDIRCLVTKPRCPVASCPLCAPRRLTPKAGDYLLYGGDATCGLNITPAQFAFATVDMFAWTFGSCCGTKFQAANIHGNRTCRWRPFPRQDRQGYPLDATRAYLETSTRETGRVNVEPVTTS